MALAAGARRALQASAARRLMPCAGLHTSSALGGKLSPEYPEHSVTKNNWVEVGPREMPHFRSLTRSNSVPPRCSEERNHTRE